MADDNISQNDLFSEKSQAVLVDLFEDLDGFLVSKVLLTAIEVDLFPLLRETGLPTAEIIDTLGLHRQDGSAFLDICSKFGYLSREGESYSLTLRSRVLLDNYQRFKGYTQNRSMIYADLVNLPSLVKTGVNGSGSIDMWPFKRENADPAALPEEATTLYSQYVDSSSRFWSQLFLDSVDLSSASALLDLGGSVGSFGMEVAKRHSHMGVGVFDLPGIAGLAQENFKSGGFGDRVRFVPGDFFSHPIPKDYDVITLMRVCLDWQDVDVSRLLTKVYSALRPAGTVMIFEPMYTGDGEDRERGKGAVRALLVRGRVRSPAEHSVLLSEAGFENISVVDTSIERFKIVRGTKG